MPTERGAVGRDRTRGGKRGSRGRVKGRVTRMRHSSMNDSCSDSDIQGYAPYAYSGYPYAAYGAYAHAGAYAYGAYPYAYGK